MSHPWETFILGGYDVPRFLIIDPENYCTNPYFMDGNVTGYGGLYQVQAAIKDEAYAEYMGKIYYSAMSATYVSVTKLMSSTPLDRTFLLSLRYMSGFAFQIAFCVDTAIVQTVAIPAATVPTRVMFAVTLETLATAGAEVSFRIYGSIASEADLYFDQVLFTEALEDIELPQPQRSYLQFEEVLTGSNERWDGLLQKINRRWRPHYYAEWDYLSKEDELKRQKINEADMLFVLPHKDSSWGIKGQWDGDFYRRYPWDRFKGHTGNTPIKGSEFLLTQPRWDSDTNTLYIEEGNLILPSS